MMTIRFQFTGFEVQLCYPGTVTHLHIASKLLRHEIAHIQWIHFSQQESYSLHKLDSIPPLEVVLTREQSLAYYKEMVEVREMEMAARDLYQKKIIRGFLHLFVGQVSGGIITQMFNCCCCLTVVGSLLHRNGSSYHQRGPFDHCVSMSCMDIHSRDFNEVHSC